jgi:alginate O-acetyltransferase complex protein AlgI
MLLNSVEFFGFFVPIVFIYYLLPHKYRWAWLLISSTFFYAYSKPSYIIVPVVIAILSFFGGILVEKSKPVHKKALFVFCLVSVITILLIFKYAGFFTSNIIALINTVQSYVFHVNSDLKNPFSFNIAVPLGISFITFQAMGYLIEIYRGNYQAENRFDLFLTYILFFPKLNAGPVERAHSFLPQLRTATAFDPAKLLAGLQLIVWGLFKKIVIADRLAVLVDGVYGNINSVDGAAVILACALFTIQLYADFSGYTDMAIGIAKILGFDLTINFNKPFSAKTVSEFWRRWHISLSSWFSDYVYNPIVINRRDWGHFGVMTGTVITFLIIGFWHGASWTFIILGAMHGTIIALENFTRKIRKNIAKKLPGIINSVIGSIYTVCFIGFSLIFFRAKDIPEALSVIKCVIFNTHFNFNFLDVFYQYYGGFKELLFIILSFASLQFYYAIKKSQNKNLRFVFFSTIFWITLVWGFFNNKQFIYNQF